MFPYSRTFRGHPEWNGRASYPEDRRFIDDQDFNSVRGLRNMSCSERNEVYRRAQNRLRNPYRNTRQRCGLSATVDNVYAANDTDRRDHRGHRRRHTTVDNLTDDCADLNMGSRSHSSGRNSPSRNVRWHDEYMPAAPGPPRSNPRNSGYYLDRAQKSSNSFQNNYVDAHWYIYGDRPSASRRPTTNTLPARSAGNSRYRADHDYPHLRFGTGDSRNIDPSESRWRGMFRRW